MKMTTMTCSTIPRCIPLPSHATLLPTLRLHIPVRITIQHYDLLYDFWRSPNSHQRQLPVERRGPIPFLFTVLDFSPLMPDSKLLLLYHLFTLPSQRITTTQFITVYATLLALFFINTIAYPLSLLPPYQRSIPTCTQ